MSRMWESIIPYENRAEHLATGRWRLAGVRTNDPGNTDGGVLWLTTTRTGQTVTAELYRDAALPPAQKVASGSADISQLDAAPAEVALAEANGSGLSGAFDIRDYRADGTCPVQVALAVDADLAALWDGITELSGFDPTAGCAEFIRLAGEDVLARVGAIFADRLGGPPAEAAWFLPDADRALPDLRRIANPAQLRAACAHRALEIALGRSHRGGGETMFSRLRDHHRAEFERALAGLVLAVRPGGTAPPDRASAARRLCRV